MRGNCLAVLATLSVCGSAAAQTIDYAEASTAQLVDSLALIDSEAPGLSSMADSIGFIADESSLRPTLGVLGGPGVLVPAVTIPPQMKELVRRGPDALPTLLACLDDARPTKVQVGGAFFRAQVFQAEYDSRARTPRVWDDWLDEDFFRNSYTLRIGDFCFALLGQVVNRRLSAVRYQPSGNLVVNSPLQRPQLAALVRADWMGVGAAQLRQSLLDDVAQGDDQALYRLRTYFPDTYQSLDGFGRKMKAKFEYRAPYQRFLRDDPRGVHLDAGMRNCATLAVCLTRLDTNIAKRDISILGVESAARKLTGFGTPAKAALLERSTSPDPAMRRAAWGLLMLWPALSDQDLPGLIEAYRLDDGHPAAEVIARVGSPAALQYLVDSNLRENDHAIASFGERALPCLMSVLADEARWRDAGLIIRDMNMAHHLQEWTQTATDTAQSPENRVVALRALWGLEGKALPVRKRIDSLRHDPDPRIRKAAEETYVSSGN